MLIYLFKWLFLRWFHPFIYKINWNDVGLVNSPEWKWNFNLFQNVIESCRSEEKSGFSISKITLCRFSKFYGLHHISCCLHRALAPSLGLTGAIPGRTRSRWATLARARCTGAVTVRSLARRSIHRIRSLSPRSWSLSATVIFKVRMYKVGLQ